MDRNNITIEDANAVACKMSGKLWNKWSTTNWKFAVCVDSFPVSLHPTMLKAEHAAKHLCTSQNKHKHTCPVCDITLTCNNPDCSTPQQHMALCGSHTQKEIDGSIKAAINRLAAYGQSCYTSRVSKGTAAGRTIYAHMTPRDCVDAAIEMLEQWNGHLSVAALRAIEKHKGKVTRKGRILTIELPEHWNNF